MLAAELARNESRALFSAVREARRKETLRVFSSQWQRYVARRGVGDPPSRSPTACCGGGGRRLRFASGARPRPRSTRPPRDALAEKHDRARTRRVDRSARLATGRRLARRRLGGAKGSRRRQGCSRCFSEPSPGGRSKSVQRLGVGGARGALQGVGSALMNDAPSGRRFSRIVSFAAETRDVHGDRRVVAGAVAHVGGGRRRARREARAERDGPAFRAWAETAWELRRRRAFGARMSSKSARRTSVTAFIAWRDATKAATPGARLERRATLAPRARGGRARTPRSPPGRTRSATGVRRAPFVRLARRRARAARLPRARREAGTSRPPAARVPLASAISPSRGTRAAPRGGGGDDWRLRAAEARRRRVFPRARRACQARGTPPPPPRGASCAAGRGRRDARQARAPPIFLTHFARRRVGGRAARDARLAVVRGARARRRCTAFAAAPRRLSRARARETAPRG